MSSSTALALFTTALSDIGTGVLTIITAAVGVAVAMFLFYFGFRKAKKAIGGKA